MVFGVRGNVLIWSIFLLVFVMGVFFHFSYRISLSNRSSQVFVDNLAFQDVYVGSLLSNDLEDVVGSDGGIDFEDVSYFTGVLYGGDDSEVRFFSGSDFYFGVVEGAPVFYGLLNIDDGGDNFVLVGSGVLGSGDGDLFFDLSGSVYANDVFYVRSLGGYSKFFVSSGRGFEAPYRFYDVYKNIGGRRIVRGGGVVDVFDEGKFSESFGIDEYKALGMYLDN